MENKFIMVSMDDERLKSISEILGNPSCKKILNLLSERRASETDISRELGMPLNTVGYNIKKLLESGLIEKAEHFFSVKGKRMPVYKVSNKSIVISPRQKTKTALKLLPVLLITGIAAWFIRFFSFSNENSLALTAREKVAEASGGALQAAAPSASVANLVETHSLSIWESIVSIPNWSWFLIGAVFVLAVYFIFSLISERGKS